MKQYTLAQAAEKLEMDLLDVVGLIQDNTFFPNSRDGVVYLQQSTVDNYLSSLNQPPNDLEGQLADRSEKSTVAADPLPEETLPGFTQSGTTQPCTKEPGSIDDVVSTAVITEPNTVVAPKPVPQVEPKVKEEWYLQAEKIYGTRVLDDLLDDKGEDTVKEVVTQLLTCVEFDATKSLLRADVWKKVYSGNKRKRMEYAGRVTMLCEEITRKHGVNIPSKYDLIKSPTNFLPHRIVKTETEFYAATDLAQPHTVRELSVMLGYNQSLVNNLQSEGFDVLYLDSMVRKGLHLDGSTPHMGGRGLKRINWRRNSVTSGLKPLGVNYDDARFLATEKQLVDTNLITYITSKKDVISFASNWADYASPGTALRNYLEEILVKK